MDTFTLFVWLCAGIWVGRPSLVHLVERDAEIVALPQLLIASESPIAALFRYIAGDGLAQRRRHEPRRTIPWT